ncbi:S24/S26 family peptidase [Halorussus salinisoli]|uniref:S26 family signal peptidase n=1 Tax=Halorussus salinisoli TaxID=2558242 RepID=UPI0010C1C4A4|nr:S26 family signal peptidase [Halorussus salinisoli]
MSSSRDGHPSDEDERTNSPPASSDGRSDDAATDGSARSQRETRPARSDGGEREKGTGPLALVRRFRSSENQVVVFVREMLSSAGIVIAIGLLLFAISGVWPPMVAIESGSMEPHMQKGDLVFIMEEGRLAPAAAQGDTGVVTYQKGEEEGYKSFNDYGDVIIYQPDGKDYKTPIIHRARFWVEEGENWYDEANKQYISADSCEELSNCPAPNSGFITKGDANPYYDQSNGMRISGPVDPSWVRGTAEVRVPWLGWVRLQFSGAAYLSPGTTALSPGATPLSSGVTPLSATG